MESTFYKRYGNDGAEIEVSHIVRVFKRSNGSVWIERLNADGEPVREIRTDIAQHGFIKDGRNQCVCRIGTYHFAASDSYINAKYPHSRKPKWWQILLNRYLGWSIKQDAEAVMGANYISNNYMVSGHPDSIQFAQDFKEL